MNAIAQWLAPAATMIAALMTAANLGARVTGWGFIVFTIGSICWVIVGLGTGVSSLVATNIFLTLVNAIGIWRWLGRQARYEAIGASAVTASEAPAVVSVFPATAIVGRKVVGADGEQAGEAVEALVDCRTGTIVHVIVRFGGVAGIGERLAAMPLADLRFESDAITTHLTAAAVSGLPPVDEQQWPRLLDASGLRAPTGVPA